MTTIHCGYLDCANNENGLCHAAAIRLKPEEGCLTYQITDRNASKMEIDQGDRLTWDREYFEDDPIDGENIL